MFGKRIGIDLSTASVLVYQAGRRVVTVDVSRRPEVARRYGIAYVPTAVAVDGAGVVTARIAG